MIPSQWYAVLDSGQVRPGRPVGVTRLGEKLVFWRDAEGQIVCQRDLCAHRGVALSKGKLREGRIECPFHGFQYDPSGRCQVIPAIGRRAEVPERFRVFTYPAREAHGFIYVWWGEPQDDLPPPRFFDDLDESFSYGQARDPWPTHYSRAIENQLDVVHLPFVHGNTIGRGGRSLVNGPVTQWLGEDRFRVYVFNEPDEGQTPLKPEEIRQPYPTFHLEFVFPNLWQNHISDRVRIVAAFVPVDEANTILYLRFYQKFVRTPLLRGLVNRLAMPFNLWVARQDRRVVVTQRPLRTSLQMGEKLVQGDRPIVAYRTRRQHLLEQAEAAPPPA